ncbi:hypothetical protein, partial [Adlercreutzia sp. DFI.6.23]|uniref:hypothetical protein n=1 Tax=Adlercreutzia sp. DFI.6.23 TaxID=2963705 RepID=UPI00210D3066
APAVPARPSFGAGELGAQATRDDRAPAETAATALPFNSDFDDETQALKPNVEDAASHAGDYTLPATDIDTLFLPNGSNYFVYEGRIAPTGETITLQT